MDVNIIILSLLSLLLVVVSWLCVFNSNQVRLNRIILDAVADHRKHIEALMERQADEEDPACTDDKDEADWWKE